MSYSGSLHGYLLVGDKELKLSECGFELEDVLQKTAEMHVGLLAGIFDVELDSCGSVVLPEGLQADLVLLSRERRDDDTDFIPVVIEFKRADNRELRREVLAQLIEYLTAIYLEPEYLVKACRDKGVDFDEENLRRNIETRRIRGIILSEAIPDIVKKAIELLNEELKNMEIYGVELKRLCSEDQEYAVIIPALIGATMEAERRKRKLYILWTYDRLRQVYNDMEDELLRRRLLDLLEWAREKGLLEEYPSNQPRFRIFKNIISVDPTGNLYVRFGRDHESKLPKPEREALFKGIKELMGFRRKDVKDVDDVADGSGTIKTIAELSEEEFEELKRLFSRIFLEK